MEDHNEFVVEYKDGTRDWIDPVEEVWEDNEYVYASNYKYEYKYLVTLVDKWVVRPYSTTTTI